MQSALSTCFTCDALLQAKEKKERYLRRQQRRAELDQKRREKSTVSESVSSTAVSASGAMICLLSARKHFWSDIRITLGSIR